METDRTTTVFIVEDSAPLQERLAEMVNEIDGAAVVGRAETPTDATAGILATQPQWVVLDFQLRGGTGIEVLRAVHPVAPSVAFIVLTNYPNPQYRRLCLAAGAGWFLDKSTEFRRVGDVIAGREAPSASAERNPS